MRKDVDDYIVSNTYLYIIHNCSKTHIYSIKVLVAMSKVSRLLQYYK